MLKILKGHDRTAVFSILSTCNCKCDMCDMWKKPPQQIGKKEGLDLLREANKNKVLVVSFTGGEPLIHPNLIDFVREARELNMIPHVATNGSLCTEPRLEALYDAGLDWVGISLDSTDPKIHNKIRGHKDLFNKVTKGTKAASKVGLSANIDTLINTHNWDKIEEVVRFSNEELDVPWAFCFPELSPNEEYYASSSKYLSLTNDQLKKAMEDILTLKKSGHKIMNTTPYIKDCLNHLNNRKTLPCRAGEKVYFISWSGGVHPCFHKPEDFRDAGKWVSRRPNCDDCFLQCFREPSVAYNKRVVMTHLGELITWWTGNIYPTWKRRRQRIKNQADKERLK